LAGLRTSIEVTIEVEIARPRLAVWSFIADVERAPEWLGEFESAHKESEGPTGVGTVVRYTVAPGHRSGTFEIVEWDPGHRLAWEGPPLAWGGGAARPRGSLEVVDAGKGQTRFVGRYQPELTGMQVLLRPYLKRWLRRRRVADTQTLKAMLEADAPS
jgi:uncharacterized protein YndB with AHSA1/START domain